MNDIKILKLYRLTRRNNDGKVPLFFKLEVNGKEKRFYTNYRIDTQKWIHSEQRVEGNNSISKDIENTRQAFSIAVHSLRINNEYNEYDITEAFNHIHGKELKLGVRNDNGQKDGHAMSFLELFDNWKELNSDLDPDYIRKADQVKSHLKEFEEVLKKSIDFKDITYEFLNRYKNYILSKPKKRKDKRSLPFSNNTVRDHIKIIKQVINLARSYGHVFEYRIEKFRVKTKSLNKHYLEIDELEKIEKVKVYTDEEEKVKDWWLFQLYIGCRYSDLPHIDLRNVDGVWLKYFREKQNDWHEVKLTRKALKILKKYKTFPLNSRGKPMKSQTINKTIKILARRAGIKKIVDCMVESGSEIFKEKAEKWSVIDTHTARRTQATLMDKKGAQIEKIRDKLGQSDTRTTKLYIGTKGSRQDNKFDDDFI